MVYDSVVTKGAGVETLTVQGQAGTKSAWREQVSGEAGGDMTYAA